MDTTKGYEIMRLVMLLACSLALFVLARASGNVALGQTNHELIKQAAVYLHARGQARSGVSMGQFIDAYATGFLVSEDGLVMTVYHLISELGDVEPETVTIEARVGSKNADKMQAWIIDAKIPTDLMMLRLASQGPHPRVTLGSAQGHKEGDTIYSYGFPSKINAPYINPKGTIESRFGPGGFLWITGINFTAGESGSPVYDSQGAVIGIAKGTEDGKGFFIPIGFAESLLARVRLSEIRAAMKDFDLLRTRFEWSGTIRNNFGERMIEISYEKIVLGEPHVKKIEIQIRGIGIKDGTIEKMPSCCGRVVQRTAKRGVAGGYFELKHEVKAVEELQRILQYTKLLKLEVEIVPFLTDGTKLRRKTVLIDLENTIL